MRAAWPRPLHVHRVYQERYVFGVYTTYEQRGTGLRLLGEAADAGSHRAEDYIARHHLARWGKNEGTLTTDELASLSPKERRRAECERRAEQLERRNLARELWPRLRGPIGRRSVTAKEYPSLRQFWRDIMWRGEVTDELELDVCATFAAAGDAHATYLLATAYATGRGGVLSEDVAARLMVRAMRMGHHDAFMWVRFARKSGRMR
ncbi:MAG: hypothetical protein Q4A01_12735 [Coriobacteriales bacterium]|nr:hypothetical protein [Coriobacteriales bacterium]